MEKEVKDDEVKHHDDIYKLTDKVDDYLQGSKDVDEEMRFLKAETKTI